jgi:uncharacterized membrane protein YfcA
MPNATGLVVAAGATSFAGNWKEAGGFPENGYLIVTATVALTFFAAFTSNTVLERPAKALAGLFLLAVALRYIPGLMKTNKTHKKGKTHG